MNIKELRDKINFYIIARVLVIFWMFSCMMLVIKGLFILGFVSACNAVLFYAIQNEIKEGFDK